MSQQACLWKSRDIAAHEKSFRHPLNPNSLVTGTHVSALSGLVRTGVSVVRIPPGKESFCYHSHYCEEEWLYILSGRGMARIDGEELEVGPGDFMGFPTPSVAHHLSNPFDEELIYLMGGEARDADIADFPDLGKRLVRRGDAVEIYDMDDAQAWEPPGVTK